MKGISNRTLRLIKKSLALAGNNPNAEEAQTALLKAQELMAKHGLSMSDVPVDIEQQCKKTTEIRIDYMRLLWWHKRLAEIIANNFRCYKYWFPNGRVAQMAFFGIESDVAIAKEVYLFAIQAIKFHANEYIKRNGITGRSTINVVKNDYIIGFLNGLDEKFKEQIDRNGWGLVIVKDTLVVQEYEKKNLNFVKAASFTIMGDMSARNAGYVEGKRFDHGRTALEG